MRFNRRIGVIAGLLATTALVSTAVATTVGAAAPPPIDVSNDHVTCTSFYGSFKLTVPLQLTPVTPVPTTANLKGTLDGCTDTDNANVHIAASKITGAYTYAANGAGALAGVSTITNGSLTVTWKTAAKTAKLVQGTSTVSFTQINGGPSGTPLTFSDSAVSSAEENVAP